MPDLWQKNFPLASVSTLHSLSLCFKKESSFYQSSYCRSFVGEKVMLRVRCCMLQKVSIFVTNHSFGFDIVLWKCLFSQKNKAIFVAAISYLCFSCFHWVLAQSLQRFFVSLFIFYYRMQIFNLINGMQMKLSFWFRKYSITFGYYRILKQKLWLYGIYLLFMIALLTIVCFVTRESKHRNNHKQSLLMVLHHMGYLFKWYFQM